MLIFLLWAPRRRHDKEVIIMADANDKAVEAARKWAESQHLSMDDPRVQRYIRSVGSHRPDVRSDEDIEVDDDYQAGVRYALENEIADWLNDDPRFKEAVLHYAESQSLPLNHLRVLRYAKGLKGSRGDFGGREQDVSIGQRK